MLIKCAFVGKKKTLIFIEMHGTTTTKKSAFYCYTLYNYTKIHGAKKT
jgi:calcineurin-like phosphoesterase